jgi:hypothetical protein
MKIKNLLTVLLFSIFAFTGCIEKSTTTHIKDFPAPEYSVRAKVLKDRIKDVIPAEEVKISTSQTETTGKPVFKLFRVEIVSPKEYPSNLFSFSSLAGDIKKAVESGIGNLDDFQKMEIVISESTVGENGSENKRSYKKEFDL